MGTMALLQVLFSCFSASLGSVHILHGLHLFVEAPHKKGSWLCFSIQIKKYAGPTGPKGTLIGPPSGELSSMDTFGIIYQ